MKLTEQQKEIALRAWNEATEEQNTGIDPKHSVLARKCRIGKEDNGIGEPDTGSIEWIELYGDDPLAATRLAILRVAAEIGKAK